MTQTPDVVREVTERVVDEFTGGAMLFTALDVSNVVKLTLTDSRHREIAPLVRSMFERGGMGPYTQTMIDVMAGGSKPARAFLYHLPEHEASLYDDAMRGQLAITPVVANKAEDDPEVTDASTEAKVRVGKDGRGRVSRHLLLNAGINTESVVVQTDPSGPRLVITAGAAAAPAASPGVYSVPFTATDTARTLTFEHPSLLHLPRSMVDVFGPAPSLVAQIAGNTVVVVRG